MKKYDCIFTGGAARGLAYTGVFKAFEELNIEIDNYIGSSIGALMLTFYAMGYNAEEIEKEADGINMPMLFCDFNFNIISDFAFSKGNVYLNWIREKIERKYYGKNYKKGKMKPVCFKDLDKKLYICATNLETSQTEVFSRETTPDCEIALAIRASSSMPALMKPVKFNEKILIDGDILRGQPIWGVVNVPKENLIEFRLMGGDRNKFSKNPIKYANAIVNAAAYNIDKNAILTHKNRHKIIEINVENVDFTKFNFNLREKKAIYKIGYEAFKAQFVE